MRSRNILRAKKHNNNHHDPMSLCSGKIAIGDAFVTIGGKHVGADHRHAANLLEGLCGSSVQIETRDTSGRLRTVTLIRQLAIIPTPSNLPEEAGIGVCIARENGSKDAVVKRMVEGSAAAVGGELQQDDVLTHVDSKTVVGMSCRLSSVL